LVNKEKILELLEKYSDRYTFYPDSIKIIERNVFLIGKDDLKKYLFIVGELKVLNQFDGAVSKELYIENKKYTIKKAYLTYENLLELKNFFPDLWPMPSDQKKSFGTGDRLGLVTASQISVFKDKDIFPILAQQSVRELNRTERSWQDVINDTLWGYFEAGFKIPFGADADHVKEISDLKKAVDAGFTMFTVDPSDHIQDISSLDKSEITRIYYSFDRLTYLEKKYLGKNLILEGQKYCINKDILIPIVVKYRRALDRVSSLYDFLKEYKKKDFDFEVSMDEIDEPVTPPEHYFIANELMDAGIDFQNLALRFVGRWEKAVDYMGDIKIFEKELKKHAKILRMFGEYKLSLHSGSEKFSTYKAFSELTEGNFHIKTAGTSWLEALRVISKSSPMLFRDLFSYSQKCFENDRDSYHLTTDTSKLQDIGDVDDRELANYLDMAEARQVLHVTFGSILTSRDEKGKYIYREKLYEKLFKNEKIHYGYVSSNIRKHLDLLTN